MSLCLQRVVGSIRGYCVNTVCPLHHFLPRFTGFQPFFLPPLPLHLCFSFSLTICWTTATFNLYLPSTDENYYPLTLSIPSRSLTSPCTFPFSGLCKPSPLFSSSFSFSALQSPPLLPIFALVCVCVCVFLCCFCICLSVSNFFSHLPSNWEADVDSGLRTFRLQIDLTVDLESREQNGQQYMHLPLVKFSAPVILVEKQLGFGISVQIKEELNRLRD